MAASLKKLRDLPAENLGLRVNSPDGQKGVLTAWAVEAKGDKGQLKRTVALIALDPEGRRLAAWERQPEKLWRAQPAAQPFATTEAKVSLLHSIIEPMLQREPGNRKRRVRGQADRVGGSNLKKFELRS